MVDVKCGRTQDCVIKLDSVHYTLNSEPIPNQAVAHVDFTAPENNETTPDAEKSSNKVERKEETVLVKPSEKQKAKMSGKTKNVKKKEKATVFTIYEDGGSPSPKRIDNIDFISSMPLGIQAEQAKPNSGTSSPALKCRTIKTLPAVSHSKSCQCHRCLDVTLQILNFQTVVVRMYCQYTQDEFDNALITGTAVLEAYKLLSVNATNVIESLHPLADHLGIAFSYNKRMYSLFTPSLSLFYITMVKTCIAQNDLQTARKSLDKGCHLLAEKHQLNVQKAELLHLQALLDIKSIADNTGEKPESVISVQWTAKCDSSNGSSDINSSMSSLSLDSPNTVNPQKNISKAGPGRKKGRPKYQGLAEDSVNTTPNKKSSAQLLVTSKSKQVKIADGTPLWENSPRVLRELNTIENSYKTPARKPKRSTNNENSLKTPSVQKIEGHISFCSESDEENSKNVKPSRRSQRSTTVGKQSTIRRAPRKLRPTTRKTNLNPVREPESESDEENTAQPPNRKHGRAKNTSSSSLVQKEITKRKNLAKTNCSTNVQELDVELQRSDKPISLRTHSTESTDKNQNKLQRPVEEKILENEATNLTKQEHRQSTDAEPVHNTSKTSSRAASTHSAKASNCKVLTKRKTRSSQLQQSPAETERIRHKSNDSSDLSFQKSDVSAADISPETSHETSLRSHVEKLLEISEVHDVFSNLDSSVEFPRAGSDNDSTPNLRKTRNSRARKSVRKSAGQEKPSRLVVK